MRKIVIFTLISSAFVSCGPQKRAQRTEHLNLNQTGKTSVILLGAKATTEMKGQASKLGIIVEGENIIRLTGNAEELNSLDIPVTGTLSYIEDIPVEVLKNDSPRPDSYSLYLAKKDFGIPNFLKAHPEADGRGVIVGVVDDGISPNQVGFQKTTTGERKFIAKGSQSSATTYPLQDSSGELLATITEGGTFSGKIDLNMDGKQSDWMAKVSADGEHVCLDLNADKNFDINECKGNFSKTGDYFILSNNKHLLMTEVDLSKKQLKIFQPEIDDDSHGEGVASVLAGYNIGNLPGFDGVAPGSKIVDYDLSEKTNKPEENEYTLGTFLLAFDWMAKNGAEVVNVSYSLFFTNAEAQTFMAQAINELVEKHNMIISFSAGNNGPGIGSLNRRLIYPHSVLVAGAYVSKELDERVHGVTGLPEEGRVVFYSSRGPGAGGPGPVLISPLSSLTHSSPDQGFRAFSGTSSASPALAGAAAVLVSAIKQQGMKVNAATVVHALRLSGKQLQDEPFVFQGYGLPQVAKALNIYRDLISGQKFLYLNHVVNRGGLDGTSAQGIFAKKSNSEEIESYRIQLTGVSSSIAPGGTNVNLLIPIRLEYTKGIQGPRELWISASANRLFVDVNLDEVLNNAKEGFGEIRVISQVDNTLMSVIPVTVVNDLNTKNFIRETLEVSSQEGVRLHLNVPEGTRGLKVKARLIGGEIRFLNVATFNSDYIRTKQFAFDPEFYIPIEKAGHHQLTLSMSGGSTRSAKVEFEVEEVKLSLNTFATTAENGKLILSNSSNYHITGEMSLVPESQSVKKHIFSNKETPELILTLPKGKYSASLRSNASHDLSYLYGNCSLMVKNESDTFIPVEGTEHSSYGDGDVTLKFRCVPFDFGIRPSDNFQWQMNIFKVTTETMVPVAIASKAKKSFSLPKMNPGIYNVRFRNDFTKDHLSLGTIEIQ